MLHTISAKNHHQNRKNRIQLAPKITPKIPQKLLPQQTHITPNKARKIVG
jgi:hypothetical protein